MAIDYFGLNMDWYMTEQGIAIAELANRAGVSEASIKNYLFKQVDKDSIGIGWYKDIAHAMGYPLPVLLANALGIPILLDKQPDGMDLLTGRFINNVRYLITKRGFTITFVAKSAGISQGGLSDLLNKKTNRSCSIEVANLLANALNYPLYGLLMFELNKESKQNF